MNVKSYGRNAIQTNSIIQHRIEQLENYLSVTNPESDIYRLNHLQHGKDSSININRETAEVLSFSLKMAEKTDGALNPALYPVIKLWGFTDSDYRIPKDSEIEKLLPLTDYKNVVLSYEEGRTSASFLKEGTMVDLGAAGKGYAGDEAVRILKEQGITSAILDLGGNVQTVGRKPDGKLWSVGIKNPLDTSRIAAGVYVEDSCVITSGGYERFFTGDDGQVYIHIFDSKTGRPVKNDTAGVTVICSSGLKGDALSTSLFAMGSEKAVSFWKKEGGFDMVIITSDNRLLYTAPLSERIKIISPFDEIRVLE